MRLSISTGLDSGGDKSYMRHVEPHGYEMGVGRRGTYDAHAHRGFTDVAYAPGGLVVHQSGVAQRGKVHVTNPGSWFGPIEFLSDFWFIKFFQAQQNECAVPDKLIDPSEATFEGCLVAGQLEAVLPFWHPVEGARVIRLAVGQDALEVEGLDAVDARLTVVL